MKTFKIKEGSHRSGFHLGFTFKNSIKFECVFDESCLYSFPFGHKSYDDINKLFGMSTTWFHHKQSARIGWRCMDGNLIEILTYSYNDGVRKNEEHDLLGLVRPGEKFVCSITDKEDKYDFTFQKGSKSNYAYDAKQKDWFVFHYFLWPYFGGDTPAPHDMSLQLGLI